MLVLTWNLFHGRSVPDVPRSLLPDFAAQLAAWEWDVALLQEVPPWWPPTLGRASGASARTALTSRNWFAPASRWAAEWRPDVIKSWGGGANAILVRGDRVSEHRVLTLRSWPERRVVHGVRLQRGWWVCNRPTWRAPRPRPSSGRAARRSCWAATSTCATRPSPASRTWLRTASTTSSRDPRASPKPGVRCLMVGSRTTLRCWRPLPRKDRREEASS